MLEQALARGETESHPLAKQGPTAEELFAQLRAMGVRCENCMFATEPFDWNESVTAVFCELHSKDMLVAGGDIDGFMLCPYFQPREQ